MAETDAPAAATDAPAAEGALAADFFYDAGELLRPAPKRSISGGLHALHASLGFQTARRNNLAFIEDGVILYIAGNTLVIRNLNDAAVAQRRIFGFDGEGIGGFSIHPSKKLFAVAEKGASPNVYIYSYPELKVHRVLRKGTERAYCDVNFSGDGEKLASVGAFPDFMLTVWDWRRERIILRTKAFAQEVFNCAFTPDNDGLLTTSGTGHIRMWKMASTFTGLKLQGDIGKFGKVELSDVETFVVLPDGKRLSATERGALLMWDGNLVKYELLLPGQKNPHDGNVSVITLDREAGLFVTAGEDGQVLWWDYTTLDQADVGEDCTFVEIEPVRRTTIAGVSVKSLVVRGGAEGRGVEGAPSQRWLVQDATSGLAWVDMSKVWDGGAPEVATIFTGHAGAVTALAASPVDHFALTAGADGSVRLWDYVGGAEIYATTFSAAATCACWCNTNLEQRARTVAVGFADGVVRILARQGQAWRMLDALKPHNGAVRALQWAPDARHFASCGDDGSVFVLRCPDSDSSGYAPVGFHALGDAEGENGASTVAALCLDWRADSEAMLLGLSDGSVAEVPLPDGSVDTSESYNLAGMAGLRRVRVRPPAPRKSVAALHAEKAAAEKAALDAAMGGDPFAEAAAANAAADAANPEEGEDEEDVFAKDDAHTIAAACVLYKHQHSSEDDAAGAFLVSFEGEGVGEATDLFECTWEHALKCQAAKHACHPLDAYPGAVGTGAAAADAASSQLRRSASGRFVLSGARNGQTMVRPAKHLNGVLRVSLHDGVHGAVSGVATSFDDRFLLSAGADGQIFASRLMPDEIESEGEVQDGRFRRKARMAHSAYEKALAAAQAAHAKIVAANAEEGAKKQPLPDAKFDAALARAEQEEQADEEEEEAVAVPPVALAEDSGAQGFAARGGMVARLPAVVAAAADAAALLAALGGAVADPVAADKHDAAAEATVVPAVDITDPEQYSIQDAKLKTEEDHQRKAADRKKDGVREQIAALQADFCSLRAEVGELPAGQRLSDEDFIIEPEFFRGLARRGEEKLREVTLELAHPTEIANLALSKLKSRFLDGVEVEEVDLAALQVTGSVVSSFRCVRLPPRTAAALAELRAEAAAEEAAQMEQANAASLRAGLAAEAAALAGGASRAAAATAGVAAADRDFDDRIEAQGHGFEARKRMRSLRRAKMAELEGAMPAMDADDPKDVRAMAVALATMGDFKLKQADDYVVPEDQRVNALKKLRQRVLLESSTHDMMADFNGRFLRLRDLKSSIVAAVRRDNARLRALNAEVAAAAAGAGGAGGTGDAAAAAALEQVEELWEPEEAPQEWPELREVVSEADLYAVALARAKEEAEARGGAVVEPPKGAVQLAEEAAALAADGAGPSSPTVQAVDGVQLAVEAGAATGLPAHLAAMLRGATVAPPTSRLQRTHADVHLRQVEAERARLLAKTARAVTMFDGALAKLRSERVSLAVALKLAEMRQMTMAREHQLLQDFEAKDGALAHTLAARTKAAADVRGDIGECQEKLVAKRGELAVWQEKEKAIMAEFAALVGSSNQFEPQLLRVFKRKIKRAKKRAGDEDEDEDDEEDWEDDSDEDDDDDDDDDDEDEEEDACPPGCDQTLYDKVLELREKRLDQEEILSEFQKAIDEMQRTCDRHINRQRQIDKDLGASQRDIQVFQTEKQKKLNEIEVCTPLSFEQIYAVEPEPVPEGQEPGEPVNLASEIDGYLVFGASALERLKARAQELVGENKKLRQDFRELHKTKTRLEKEKKTQVAGIAMLEKKCEDLQLLKFGQKIDLEALDGAMDSKSVDDVNEKIRVEELKNERQLAVMKKQHKQFREAVLRSTQANTALLESIAALSQKQFKLEKELNSSSGQLHVNDRGPLIKNEVEERNRLVQLVKLQAKEVDALKAEVNMLRRKGGHVYTPAAAPPPAPGMLGPESQ